MIRTLQKADLEALLAIREISFPGNGNLPAARERHLTRLPWTRGYFTGGKLASATTMYPFQMYFAGKLLSMGGLASVQTLPEFRRRGLVRELFFDGLERLHDQGVGWCLEHPFDPRFYARYGWQSVIGGFQVSFPSELLLQCKQHVEARRLDPATDALTPLQEIHRIWAAQHNFPLSRDDASQRGWKQLIKPPWAKEPALIYLLQDAYCLLRLEPNADEVDLTVIDYAFGCAAGRDKLLAFLGNFAGQSQTTETFLPSDEPLLFDLQAYIKPNAHPRVVDVKVALEALSTPDEGAFKLRIHDDFCAWNDETFEVIMDKGVHLAPCGGEADVSLDIRTLALLLSGALRSEAACAGLIEGRPKYARALGNLSGARHPFMALADYF